MTSLLSVAGREVLFAHWPVDPDELGRRVPEPLAPATYDGTAWVSVLALTNGAVGVGPARLGTFDGVPQLNLRTYVTAGAETGVYFLSLDTGRRTLATTGRRLFGLPYHHASMRATARDDRITFRSRRRGRETPAAVFQARYRPTGATYRAEPGSLESFCVESFRYYLPASEDRRIDPLRPGDTTGSEVRVGTISREPWTLQPAAATIRRNTLFEAAGLPAPTGEPVVHYSPGFEMAVGPIESRVGVGQSVADPS
jgi:hypothetical protein